MVMVLDHQISKAKACKILGFSRSAFYQSTVDWAAKDAPVIVALNEIINKSAQWGFWKCFHRIRSDGYVWEHKRKHRVDYFMKLIHQRMTKKRVVTREKQSLKTA